MRRRSASTSFTIGCSFPLTGPLASDGEQMKNGVTLAASEINAAGGVAGKQINLSIVDTDVTDPAKIKTSLQKHVNDKVDALYEGYLIQWPASMDIKANYGAPCLDASTSIDQVKQIQGSAKYGNIFQIDPPESYYGLGFPGFLNQVKAAGKWKPQNNQIFIVEGDSVYSQTISKFAQQQAPKQGWKIKGVTKVTGGAADWSPSAKKAKDSKAAVVMNTHFAPDDLAKWTKAWAANPGKSLVYLQYGPSIPAYLTLAGKAANGIVWATVTGVYNDPVGKIFRTAYKAKFGTGSRLLELGLGLRRSQHARARVGGHGRRPELQGQHRPAQEDDPPRRQRRLLADQERRPRLPGADSRPGHRPGAPVLPDPERRAPHHPARAVHRGAVPEPALDVG